MTALGASDVNELRNKVPEMRRSLEPSAGPLAKKIYASVFVMSLETAQKQLGKDVGKVDGYDTGMTYT